MDGVDSDGGGSKWGWDDAYQYLVEHGHADPGALTLEQFDMCIQAAHRLDMDRRRVAIYDACAPWNEQAAFEKYMKQFEPKPDLAKRKRKIKRAI